MRNKNKHIIDALEDENLEIIGIEHIMNLVNGNVSRAKNGNLKLSIELPPGVVDKNIKGIPFGGTGWAIKPFVIFALEYDEETI